MVPDKIEKAELFQGAGDGYGYKLNDWRSIQIEHRKGLLKLNRIGNFNGQRITSIEAIGVPQKPQQFLLDGKPTEKFDYDKNKKLLKIEINEQTKEIALVL